MEVSDRTGELRQQLVAVALEWERVFGVEPWILSALAAYDAARLVGHTNDSYGKNHLGRAEVTYGSDFSYNGLRYQVKANRLGKKPSSVVTRASEARNYHWDKLIWLLYDHKFIIQEAWEWEVGEYRAEFEGRDSLTPSDMRRGKRLK